MTVVGFIVLGCLFAAIIAIQLIIWDQLQGIISALSCSPCHYEKLDIPPCRFEPSSCDWQPGPPCEYKEPLPYPEQQPCRFTESSQECRFEVAPCEWKEQHQEPCRFHEQKLEPCRFQDPVFPEQHPCKFEKQTISQIIKEKAEEPREPVVHMPLAPFKKVNSRRRK